MSNSVPASTVLSRIGKGETKRLAQFKLVLLGEMAVGKSSLVLRFVKEQFDQCQLPTVGGAFLTRTVCLDYTTVKYEIWDTAGQERYHAIAPMYYRGAQAAIVVYDITDANSLARAKAWVRELQCHAPSDILIALAGNKSDLEIKREVQYEEADEYAKKNDLIFMETSAKNSHNVNEIFLEITRRLCPKVVSAEPTGTGSGGTVVLGTRQNILKVRLQQPRCNN